MLDIKRRDIRSVGRFAVLGRNVANYMILPISINSFVVVYYRENEIIKVKKYNLIYL